MAQAEHSQSTGRDTGTNLAEGFGRFKNDLADHLDLPLIHKLSNWLGLKRGQIERITTSTTPGHDMVDLLESREKIAPTSIEALVNMLKQSNLGGVAHSILNSFQATTGQSLRLEDTKEDLIKCAKIASQKHYGTAKQEVKSDQFLQSVKKKVSETIFIDSNDNEVLQRSTIQVLEVASANQIPIPCVILSYCSPRVDEYGLNLILQSGFSLSILSSLQELRIFDINRRLTKEELAAILSYFSQCTSLKELEFQMYNLPDTIPVESIPSSLKSRNVKVWKDRLSSSHFRRLNLQTGRWQACDIMGRLPGEEDISASSLSVCHVPSQSADVRHPKKRRPHESTAAVMDERSSSKDDTDEDGFRPASYRRKKPRYN